MILSVLRLQVNKASWLKFAIFATVIIAVRINSTHASEFETDTWPGEGIPNFSAKYNSLTLHRRPAKNSEEISITIGGGSSIVYDRSKQITLKSVMLTAVTEVTDMHCPGIEDNTPAINPGDRIEYLQYRAEGYITARVRGSICEVFVMDNVPKFKGLEMQPQTEWWLRVVDADSEVLGWLLVDDSQLNYLDRGF